jgi:DNA-binding MarR family transcriptional regulator
MRVDPVLPRELSLTSSGRPPSSATQVAAEREALQPAVRAVFATSALLDPIRLAIWDREGLTVTQLRLLFQLHEHGGMSNADLADRLYVTRPSVSALLERLERGGFIRREVSQIDRRGICIWLEDRGMEVIASLRTELREYVSGLMESMTDQELQSLTSALEVLVNSGRQRRLRDLETVVH